MYYITKLANYVKHTLEIKFVDPVCLNESNTSDKFCCIQSAGTSQGLKLTLNVETDEYMAGPASGSGAFVSKSEEKFVFNTLVES